MFIVGAAAFLLTSCSGAPPASVSEPAATPRSLVIITIDTLRPDRVGAYGYQPARTPVMDALARAGARFTHAFAPAPITLPSHVSLMTGRYPPGHGSRHNGMSPDESVPVLAAALKNAGFATGAFVSAFPLDKRFGLARGFDRYDDELPRAPDGRPLNERSGLETARRAEEWLNTQRGRRFFLWMHLFEPHAPYGDAASGSAPSRYDDEVAIADQAVGRVLAALGDEASRTLVVVTADHGEAFGEHGEMGHSIFVYDTTLRVPLMLRGPGIPASAVIDATVSLVDIAPTVAAFFGVKGLDGDGVSLTGVLTGARPGDRTLYAESFAPLLDFGWSPLRAVRDGAWKYIAAPRAELYDMSRDPVESTNLFSNDPQRVARLRARLESYGPGDAPPHSASDSDAARRLRSLGYLGGSRAAAQDSGRPDPKDRIVLAARLATVMAGEVKGEALIATLEAILKDDPANPQAHLRLGYAEIDRGRCDRAEPHLRRAVGAQMPSADAGLGLAQCRSQARDLRGAERALQQALEAEPGNPVVLANLGLAALTRNDTTTAIPRLRAALSADPNLHEARFALARALAVAGQRDQALAEAQTLLSRLPAGAPERREVERLISALR